MIAAKGEWLMAIGCQCGVGGRDDRRRGWLKSIGCQCLWWGCGRYSPCRWPLNFSVEWRRRLT